ncbi:MAG: SurA N-terminal domain-containing protein, partial [Gemmatimonadota bacterium]
MLAQMRKPVRAERRPACAGARAALAGMLAAGALGSALPARSSAQEPPGTPDGLPPSVPDSAEFVDGVVAVVGDTVVLFSELRQEFFRLQSQGQGATLPQPGTPEWLQLGRQILWQTADRLMLLQRAKRAGLSVSEPQIDAYTEQMFQRVRGQFSSDEEMARAVEGSGMNMFSYRQMLRSQALSDLLIDAYRRQLVRDGALPRVTVTEEEARAYFEANYTRTRRPATISFNRVLAMPLPD